MRKLADAKTLIVVPGLLKIKQLALRRNVWYKSLNHLERSIIDLTVKYVDSIKSAKLAQVVTGIVSKLESALESIVDRLARSVGLSLAQKISSIAVSWGNRSAHAWAEDLTFFGTSLLLTIISVNRLRLWNFIKPQTNPSPLTKTS